MESILSTSAQWSTFAQCEKSWTCSLGVASKQHMMSKFWNDRASITDLNKAANSYITPRANKEVCFMSPVGQKTKQIETLEDEWRFCGNGGLHHLLIIGFIIWSTFFINVTLLLLIFYVNRIIIKRRRRRSIKSWQDIAGSMWNQKYFEWIIYVKEILIKKDCVQQPA